MKKFSINLKRIFFFQKTLTLPSSSFVNNFQIRQSQFSHESRKLYLHLIILAEN